MFGIKKTNDFYFKLKKEVVTEVLDGLEIIWLKQLQEDQKKNEAAINELKKDLYILQNPYKFNILDEIVFLGKEVTVTARNVINIFDFAFKNSIGMRKGYTIFDKKSNSFLNVYEQQLSPIVSKCKK